MNQTTLSFLDQYCERAGEPGLWAEPLNAITNLAFIVAAIFVARQLRRLPVLACLDVWLLTLVLFSIGVGSGLWHLYATHATLLADVIPIAIFMHVFLICALRRLLHLNWLMTLLGLAAFIGLGMMAEQHLPPEFLNGSVMYLPSMTALVLMTLALKLKQHPAARGFLVALLVFLASITFRTVDMAICETLPLGSHFLWHMLNAYVLWRLLMTLIPARAVSAA
jgi:hypothetical protein